MDFPWKSPEPSRKCVMTSTKPWVAMAQKPLSFIHYNNAFPPHVPEDPVRIISPTCPKNPLCCMPGKCRWMGILVLALKVRMGPAEICSYSSKLEPKRKWLETKTFLTMAQEYPPPCPPSIEEMTSKRSSPKGSYEYEEKFGTKIGNNGAKERGKNLTCV